MAEIKTRPNRKSVPKFLNSIENETRRRDGLTLLKIFIRITGRKPVMWGNSIIGFGKYHYSTTNESYPWMITGFSPRKQNLAIYVMQGFTRFEDDLNRLGKIKTTRSCLYINKLSDVDVEQLELFITKIVEDMEKRHQCDKRITVFTPGC